MMYKAHRRRQLQMGSKNCFIAFRKKAKRYRKVNPFCTRINLATI